MSRRVAIIGFVLSLLFTAFALYAVAFWAWVSATPLSPAQRSRVEYNYYVWLLLAGVGIVSTVTSAVIADRKRKRTPSDLEVKQ